MKFSHSDVSGSVTRLGSILSVADAGIGALLLVISARSAPGVVPIGERSRFMIEGHDGRVRNVEAEIATIVRVSAGLAITLIGISS